MNLFTKSTLALLAMVSMAQADGVKIVGADYGGTGCPAGSASVTISPDNSALSVLFDSYVMNATTVTYGKQIMDRKSCNLTIPVKVPQGYSVAIFDVDYRGFANIPVGGRGQFRAEYFWAGSRGPTFVHNFVTPFSDVFNVGEALIAQSLVWAPCGQSLNLRVNTAGLVQSGRSVGSTAEMQLDSADLTSSLVYHLKWRTCQ